MPRNSHSPWLEGKYPAHTLSTLIVGGLQAGAEIAEIIVQEHKATAEGQIPTQLLHPQSEPKGHLDAPSFDDELNFD